jgi:hypothetical protein
VSAGGGRWYTGTLRGLPLGARIFVHIPKAGYVGVGNVVGEAMSFDEAVLEIDGAERKMAELPLHAGYNHSNDADDNDEYIVPVEWIRSRSREDAIWEPGFFANQNSACKLRNRFTLPHRRLRARRVIDRSSPEPCAGLIRALRG